MRIREIIFKMKTKYNYTNELDLNLFLILFQLLLIRGSGFTDCTQQSNGVDCQVECSENCKRVRLDDLCDTSTGVCLHGCISGHRGRTCTQPCTNHTYGENCARQCSPHCGGIKRECNSLTGKCLAGCTDGYEGDKCMRAIKAADLDYQTGILTFIPAIIPLAIVSVLVIAFIYLARYEDHKREGVTENESQPELQFGPPAMMITSASTITPSSTSSIVSMTTSGSDTPSEDQDSSSSSQ